MVKHHGMEIYQDQTCRIIIKKEGYELASIDCSEKVAESSLREIADFLVEWREKHG